MSGVTCAAEVSDLYEAEVRVADRGANQRKVSLRNALAEVLVKITGARNVTSRANLAPALERASEYVQQYRYRLVPEAEGSSAQSEAPRWLLWTRFDSEAINRLLRERHLSVWGSTRPVTLLWLAVEDQGRRDLIGADSDPATANLVTQVADGRGTPILLPLLDLEDQRQLNFSDVWGDFEDAIFAASERYASDVVLVGRAARRGGATWSVRWSLYQGNNAAHWETSENTQRGALWLGMQNAMDVVVSRFAPLAGEDTQTSVLLHVDDINTVFDYARVSRYLKALTPVEAIQPVQVKPTAVLFRLRLRGGAHSLRQALSLGGLLRSDDVGGWSGDMTGVDSSDDEGLGARANSDGTADASKELYYRLNR